MLNSYAKILKEQGHHIIEEDGVFWYEYQGFMMPAYLPHCVPEIGIDGVSKVLKQTKKPFIRWDSNFGRLKEGQWWYILKRGSWDVEDVKSKKKRWMIRQGKKNFTVRPLSYDEVLDLCPKVALAAATRYRGDKDVEDRSILLKRVNAGIKVPGVLEYIGCFKDSRLVSYSENYIQANAVWLAIIRHDPDYLNEYSSYGLMDGILDYYLNLKQYDYVLDGSRSIHHKTNFQEHLFAVFGFSKEYAVLNVLYNPGFSLLVKICYPFYRVFDWLDNKIHNSIVANINAVLKQEFIRRSVEKKRL
jgi:hypothetical protein